MCVFSCVGSSLKRHQELCCLLSKGKMLICVKSLTLFTQVINSQAALLLPFLHTSLDFLFFPSALSLFLPAFLSSLVFTPPQQCRGVSEEARGRSSGAHLLVYVHLCRHWALMESNHLSPAACDGAAVSEKPGHRNELPKNHLTDTFQTNLASSLVIVSLWEQLHCNANTKGALQSFRWQCDRRRWENLVWRDCFLSACEGPERLHRSVGSKVKGQQVQFDLRMDSKPASFTWIPLRWQKDLRTNQYLWMLSALSPPWLRICF